jgi:hypothetical protein
MNNSDRDSKEAEATLKLKKLLRRNAPSSKSAQMCLDEISKGASINIHPGLANFLHIQRIYKMRFAATQTQPSSIVGFEETLHNFSTFQSPRIKMSGVTSSQCEFVIFTDSDITQLIGCLADPNPSLQSEAISLESMQLS